MKHKDKRRALMNWKRGNPTDIIKLYTNYIEELKSEFSKASCQGCAKGFYTRKIQKYEEEIRKIKGEKRFRNFNFGEIFVKKD